MGSLGKLGSLGSLGRIGKMGRIGSLGAFPPAGWYGSERPSFPLAGSGPRSTKAN
jgi:hypothetical protein